MRWADGLGVSFMNFKKNSGVGKHRKGLLTGASVVAGALAAMGTGAAQAQQAAADEEIVVTGTRIAHPDIQSTSPLQVVGQDEVTYQGRVAVEDLLATLPAVSPEFNQGVDNGAIGTATTQLRNLGSVRTLVL